MAQGLTRDITAMLAAWSKGDQGALEELVPAVDRELRHIARRHMENSLGFHQTGAPAAAAGQKQTMAAQ